MTVYRINFITMFQNFILQLFKLYFPALHPPSLSLLFPLSRSLWVCSQSRGPKGRAGTGDTIYTYDVNSLYPYAMSKFPMPVGYIRFFEGDILKLIHSQTFKGKGEKKPFGFFEV